MESPLCGVTPGTAPSPWRRVQCWDMATLGKLDSLLAELKLQCYTEGRDAEQNRIPEYTAAVKIQSWYRGCRVRAYLRYLNKMMTVIQKWWRGYLARTFFRSQVKTAYFIMKINFYNEMAVRIQRRWRGYYVRKYIHNYYALKKYLEAVAVKNNIIRKELGEFAEMKANEKLKKACEMEEKRKDYRARKLHYLVSTKQVPGVFNSPYRQYPDDMEFRLERSKPLSPKDRQKKKDKSIGIVDWQDCRHPFTFPTTPSLPPIGRKKPQGPFRDTAVVLQQRYKPLEPTLRVATSINSEEEARAALKREELCKNIQDNIFTPPFSSINKNKVYEPLLHTSTDYKKIPYGTVTFRDEQQSKRITKKDFQTVFTPVHLFDKYGRMYSKAGEAV